MTLRCRLFGHNYQISYPNSPSSLDHVVRCARCGHRQLTFREVQQIIRGERTI